MSPDAASPPPSLITLVFHKIQSGFSYGSTNYSPGRFLRLVDALEKSGLPVRLSFDDGYAHLMDCLPGLVDRLAAPPLVFVPTAWIGKVNRWDYSSLFRKVRHLSENEITDLAARGVQFGSHGHHHRDLTSLPESELIRDLGESRRILQALTGQEITDVSYPFGRHSEQVRRLAHQAGYRQGFTMTLPDETKSALATGRVPVYAFDSQRVIFRRMRQGRGRRWEGWKVKGISALSGGTILLNRWRGM